MHIDENWAVTTARARAFFDAQPDVIACADGFRCGDCSIQLMTIPAQDDHPFAMQRTRLLIDGPEFEVRARIDASFCDFFQPEAEPLHY